jgi:hypothetical protein
MSQQNVKWGAEWYSRNRLNGTTRYLMWIEPNRPALFSTRQAARAWIHERYGYIRGRRDLRTEPHGWRLPRAVRVRWTLNRVKS